jgi:hypothetical protein
MLQKSSSAHRMRAYYHSFLPVQMECHTLDGDVGTAFISLPPPRHFLIPLKKEMYVDCVIFHPTTHYTGAGLEIVNVTPAPR